MWKNRNQMNASELFMLKMGRFMQQKKIKGQILYKID